MACIIAHERTLEACLMTFIPLESKVRDSFTGGSKVDMILDLYTSSTFLLHPDLFPFCPYFFLARDGNERWRLIQATQRGFDGWNANHTAEIMFTVALLLPSERKQKKGGSAMKKTFGGCWSVVQSRSPAKGRKWQGRA